MAVLPADLNSLELFTGAGGLALGSHIAGFHHEALIEWDRDSCITLKTNAALGSIPGIKSWKVIESDVRRIDYSGFGAVDLIAGGPPCQPFSIGGKHSGPNDRRDMIPEMIRAVVALTPRAVIIENVRGLLRSAFRTYFGYVILQLTYPKVIRRDGETWTEHLSRLEVLHLSGRGKDDLHYNVVFRSINAANYGIPQTRERVFIVAFRADTGIDWHFPEATHSREALIYEQWTTGTYWKRMGIEGALVPKDLKPPLMKPETLPWKTVREALVNLPEPTADRDAPGVLNHRLVPGARPYVGHTGSPLDWPAKTLKAGDHGVPGGENMIALEDGAVRYFTVREAARLQTFPDTWKLAGSWTESMRQLGNAVPVELGKLISESVANALIGSPYE